ncbi:hypothetical protein HOLleu_14888 [Holothuria leucospilota]|uniref:Fibrinogen C-terminal domain-containing protein n=1 Tax=Holothuria leucospilota TaxID=206669 RepID=A0A9Q1C752_HOLLE|nr:hypothetical protein HOLleu_14888 [Holothuria leucospilota]
MLTFQDNVQLRFDLDDFDDAHNVAVYDNFRIGDETAFFQLSLGTRVQGLPGKN